MKRDSHSSSIIPKIIIFLGTLGVVGIILLFFRSRPLPQVFRAPPETPEKLFAQVIQASLPQILKLWEEGDSFIRKEGVNCPEEIDFSRKVGRSYYQCQPHFWQCFWSGGVTQQLPELKTDAFGQTYTIRANPSFSSIPAYSAEPRYYELVKTAGAGLNLNYAMMVEVSIREIPGQKQTLLLTDTCRDTYLPQRIYGYGPAPGKKEEGFLWDNFDREIFLDKFYVSTQQVNEWRLLRGEVEKVVKERSLWPKPALLDLNEQRSYCAFFGKRLLEAKLFDAATMTPADLQNSTPEFVPRPQTPWQRDLSKSFLGVARINPDYQLTPLDCQLAQVQGCPERYFTTDSATWMGIHYGLGFYPESFANAVEDGKNLKLSSRFFAAASEWHELGKRTDWSGLQQDSKAPVAFRCYEEVAR